MDAKPLIPPISNQNQYPHFLFTSYFHPPIMQILRGSIPTMKNLNLTLSSTIFWVHFNLSPLLWLLFCFLYTFLLFSPIKITKVCKENH